MELRRSPRFQILSISGERIGTFTDFDQAKARADRLVEKYGAPFTVYRVEEVYTAKPKAETGQ